MADRPHLVLASGSPRRMELLARLRLHPEQRPADIDEAPLPDEDAYTLVIRLAGTKASVSARTDDEVVLAADTVVVYGGRILGKPHDADEAASMLARLSGRTHEVITGIAVRRGATHLTDAVTTRVTFRSLSMADIAWYVSTREPHDKAGAYGLQGAGAVLVERIDGCDTNVIGLPLPHTVALLREVGFEPLDPSA
ncbi:MAG: septum formation protein Maf [Nitriliruptor sp.]|nr:MAG: septum formation protein Maf [Nitriliruptor sp.]